MTTPKCPLCGMPMRRYWLKEKVITGWWKCDTGRPCELSCVPLSEESIRRLTPPTDEQILKIAHRYMHLFEMDRINLDFSDEQMINCYKGIGWPNEHGE